MEDYGAVIGKGHIEKPVIPEPEDVCTPIFSLDLMFISVKLS